MSTKLYDISNWCKQGDEVDDYPYIGEIDASVDIGEVVKIGNDYYVPGIISYVKNSAGVRKVELNLEPENKDYENDLTCPYCGYRDNNSWELSDDEEEHECGQCAGIISYERIVTVEYNSCPVRPPIIVSSNWI